MQLLHKSTKTANFQKIIANLHDAGRSMSVLISSFRIQSASVSSENKLLTLKVIWGHFKQHHIAVKFFTPFENK